MFMLPVGKSSVSLKFHLRVFVLTAVCLGWCDSHLQAQRYRGGPGQDPGAPLTLDQQIQNEAEGIRNIGIGILQDYVLARKPLSQFDIEEIQKELKKAKKFLGRFIPEDQAYYYMIEAYCAHYSNDKETAFKSINKSIQKGAGGGGNTDFSDSGILMAFYWQDYETAGKLLKDRDAGMEACANVYDSLLIAPAPVSGPSGAGDPNTVSGRAPRTETKPNVPTPPPSTPTSRWSINRDATQNPTTTRRTSRRTSSRNNARRAPEAPREIKLDPSKLDDMAPVHNEYVKDRQRLERTQQNSEHNGGPGSNPYSSGRTTRSRGQSVLNLPVDYISRYALGETIGTMKLRNLNGSYFQYEPGKGQVLCALLWTLPMDRSSRGSSSRRSSTNYDMGMEYEMEMQMMGGGGGYGSGYGSGSPTYRRGNQQLSEMMQSSTDLNGNADQFRSLYANYTIRGRLTGLAGRVSFVGINFNPAHKMYDVANTVMENPWPWSNCMFDDPMNKNSLQGIAYASPVMMIVGTNGRICYTGPVGGILPQIVLAGEVQKAVVASGGMPTLPSGMAQMPAMTSSAPKKKGLWGALTGGGAKTQTAPDNTGTASAQTQPKQYPTIEDKPSILQAQQMLSSVETYRRLMPNKALDTCDDILKRWPDSLEADKAREVIKSILRSKPNLKDDRQRRGKYVG